MSIARRAACLLGAALILDLMLVLPNQSRGLVVATALRLPLELPVILLVLAALPRDARISYVLRVVLVAVLVALVALKLADIGTFTAFARPFNPAVDLFMIEAGTRFGISTIGLPLVILAALGGALALAGLIWTLWWASGQWLGLASGPVARSLTGVAAALGVLVIGAQQSNSLPLRLPWYAGTTHLASAHLRSFTQTLADLKRFRAAAANDPFAGSAGLFDRLQGRDVLIVFIESYGRASFDNPLYAPTHVATLENAAPKLAQAGLAMRSGWLTSPTEGGQSWLAHSTLESGLTISDQTRYRALLASPRRTLFDLAAASGLRTAAVMPGITLSWPEGPMQGFQTILEAADLGYQGQPFNFVTMPDQYTLSAFDRLVAREPQAGPLFAQIVLLSSHAPWVPVPEMIAWDQVGDGRVFDRWALSGDPPKVVWRDRDRVRDQYRQAIDYSLQAILSYAGRHANKPPLMVVLGDHQPTPFVAQIDSKDVPVHLIGPPDLIADFDAWSWTPGLVPDAQTPVWPMRDFRDRFINALTSLPIKVAQ
ncbi:sulfatase-like hydrolase/transferase [uncultured Thioclava sp.]|uniref:sulfatase-like hydrolase/transferase n=1 Tax=uncultured Thioclava sp. TaxID=473858 RepID=UPI0025FA063E|nr:sulfatase-like hydrolase/transferase [uncultured Thioclava sp.]